MLRVAVGPSLLDQDAQLSRADFTGNQMSASFPLTLCVANLFGRARTLAGQAKAVDDDHDLNKFSLKMTRRRSQSRRSPESGVQLQ